MYKISIGIIGRYDSIIRFEVHMAIVLFLAPDIITLRSHPDHALCTYTGSEAAPILYSVRGRPFPLLDQGLPPSSNGAVVASFLLNQRPRHFLLDKRLLSFSSGPGNTPFSTGPKAPFLLPGSDAVPYWLVAAHFSLLLLCRRPPLWSTILYKL